MECQGPHIKNVKISITLKKTGKIFDAIRDFSLESTVSKKTASFFVFRDIFIYTIFYTGHINCTGIKSLSDINKATRFILTQLKLSSNAVENIRTDSILAADRISRYICISDFAKFLRDREYNVQYNPQRFPGLCIRNIPGCVLTFISGKVIFSGIKSENNLTRISELIRKLYNDYCNMSASFTSSNNRPT